MQLFQELKRRNVFRVAAAYVVVSWLLIQVVVGRRFSVAGMARSYPCVTSCAAFGSKTKNSHHPARTCN